MKMQPRLSFVEAVIVAFSKVFVFKGRARRSEFWGYGWFITIYATMLLGFAPNVNTQYVVLLCSMILISAATVRRLHDVGKSGTYIFISLIPLIGFLYLLVPLLTDSQPTPNRYGNSPKYAEG